MQAYLIQRSITTGRLRLSLQQKLTHFLPVSIGVIMPIVGLFIIFQSYFNNKAIPQRILNPWIWIISIALAVSIYWLQYKRLRLKTVETSLNPDEVLSIFTNAVEQLKWKIVINNKKVIIAKVNNGWLTGSWGEQVTIILDENKIYLNSICDPDKRSSLISFGNNKKNITKVLHEIERSAKRNGNS